MIPDQWVLQQRSDAQLLKRADPLLSYNALLQVIQCSDTTAFDVPTPGNIYALYIPKTGVLKDYIFP